MTDLVPVTRTIVDYPDNLARYLRTTSAAGRLLTAARDIDPIALESGKFAIRVTVREPAPKPTLRQRMARFDRAHPIFSSCLKALMFGITALSAVLGILFGVGWLIWSTVGAATLSSIGLGVVLVVLGTAAAMTTSANHRGHKGEGFHWSKCK